MRKILGISAFYHDSAACLIEGRKILAAAQEERFTRKKHDPSFPIHAIRFCLRHARVDISDVDAIVYYDKPILTFERLLETYLQFAPKGMMSFLAAMPIWLKEKFFLKQLIRKTLKHHFNVKQIPQLLFSEHHGSHAASAFYPSPYYNAAVLCMDGVGEWATTSAWHGIGNSIKPLWELRFPHSLGLLYSAITHYLGFKVNSGEYKVMGLAPYGRPLYVQTIYNNLIDLKEDGSFRLNMDYFDFCTSLHMTGHKLEMLFGGERRKPESRLTQREMDIARSIQDVTEDVVLRLATKIQQETGCSNLCLAGGVALNCVANGKLLRKGVFKNIWIQPAAGDAGGSLGCAFDVLHNYYKISRDETGESADLMRGALLGPSFNESEILDFLQKNNIPYRRLDWDELYECVAQDLADEKVIGWFQGRMEFGPRALGARSIIGDARSKKMQSVMNIKIKHRESFRPFAPSVLRESVQEYFEINVDSPYMLLVADVKKTRRILLDEKQKDLWGIELLNVPKSDIPAVTHVDYSARVQTVHEDVNPRYHRLIRTFERKTGCPVIVNTSFNVRGEPIVCSPQDAYRCFMRTDMDTLVLENFVLDKVSQPRLEIDSDWKNEFDLD